MLEVGYERDKGPGSWKTFPYIYEESKECLLIAEVPMIPTSGLAGSLSVTVRCCRGLSMVLSLTVRPPETVRKE